MVGSGAAEVMAAGVACGAHQAGRLAGLLLRRSRAEEGRWGNGGSKRLNAHPCSGQENKMIACQPPQNGLLIDLVVSTFVSTLFSS